MEPTAKGFTKVGEAEVGRSAQLEKSELLIAHLEEQERCRDPQPTHAHETQ
jgi:hypothetical protein